MITAYSKKGYPIVRLNKNAIDMVVYEFVENGVDGCRCLKCGGPIDPIGKATRTD